MALRCDTRTKTSTIKKYLTVQTEGSRQVSRETNHYNLQMIIAVGYRVKSQRGVQFRIWATGVLQAMDKARAEYRKYQEITLTPVEQAYLESIKEVAKEVKKQK